MELIYNYGSQMIIRDLLQSIGLLRQNNNNID